MLSKTQHVLAKHYTLCCNRWNFLLSFKPATQAPVTAAAASPAPCPGNTQCKVKVSQVCSELEKWISSHLTYYLLTSDVRSIWENLKPWCIDVAIARSMLQSRDLRFSQKDRTFEVNKFITTWRFSFFLQSCCRPNNALELSSHRKLHELSKTTLNSSKIILNFRQYRCIMWWDFIANYRLCSAKRN